MKKSYAGIDVELDVNGYLTDPYVWSPEIAIELAWEDGIELTERHLLILSYLRINYFIGESLSIRKINHSGIVTLKEFYSLFPGAPLKKSCRIAGLPDPGSCV